MNLFVNSPLQLLKERVNPGEILVQRIAPAPTDPLDPLAQLSDGSQVFRPQVVDGGQRHQPFELARTRGFTTQNGLPPPLDGLALPFDDALVLVQKPPDLQVLPFHHALDAFRVVRVSRIVGGIPHEQIILERNEEAGYSRIALASGAAAKLVVDTAAFVPIRADNVQSAQFRHAFSELDIDTAPGHVRGNSHGASLAGAGDDGGLFFFIARIQDLMRNAREGAAEALGLLHARRAYQYGPAGPAPGGDLCDHSKLFFPLRPELDVGMVDPDHG